MFAMHNVPRSQLVLAIKSGPVEYTSQRDDSSRPTHLPYPLAAAQNSTPQSILLSKKIIKQMDSD